MPDAPLVDADQLRTLASLGVEVGAHGMEHVFMPGLSDAELRRNTQEASDALADLVGRKPRAFAYPGGALDDRVAAAVEQAGFRVAFSVARDDLGTFRVKLVPAYQAASRALAKHPHLRYRIRDLVAS
jgi:peptidoglycan/xylan/chitin deacetylase (PgdA/CDA1 family)